MLMFVAAFLTFMSIGGFPSFVEDMKIFTRERLNGHYGVAACLVGNTVSSIPYLLLISVAPGAMAYYLGVMILSGGFFRLPHDLPKPFWKFPMYYIAFHKYVYQGFYKNEFLGLTFPNEQIGGPSMISGDEVLRSVWQVEMGGCCNSFWDGDTLQTYVFGNNKSCRES
ncbi:hypothetical protein BC332_10524 [Capsicum chinense]|nr:hypothetical protein BC332_10524 [Capsicum chinense]